MNDYKNKTSDYNLTVSQFARLCNTTRDTLRHYYEMKILMPRIDEDNGYHYYASFQLSTFYFISSLRAAGCSLKEIRELLNNYTEEKISRVLHEKLEQMQLELKELHHKIDSLTLDMNILEDYDKHKDASVYTDKIENWSVFKTPVKNKDNASHINDVTMDINTHLARESGNITDFHLCPIGSTMDYNDLCNENYVYNNVVSLTLAKPDFKYTFPLPSDKIVCCYHDSTEKDISSTYRRMVNYIKKNKLTICSDLHIISLVNIYETIEKHTYFKYLFICIK